MERIIIACLVLLFGLYGCNEKEAVPESVKKTIFYPSSTMHYKRDSLFIAATVWQFIDKEIDIFDSYKQYNVPLSKVKIHVDSIFYSPDSLKLFSFVITENPDLEDKDTSKLYYSGSDFVGFRQSVKEPWTIYFSGLYRPAGWPYYNQVRNLFRYHYLQGEFKNGLEYAWDYEKKEVVSYKWGYSVSEKKFWTKSLLWRMGARIPNYYIFQTVGNATPLDTNGAIIHLPKLDYSDSLLNLYR